MNLQELYNRAKVHKDTHKSCGGEPYKYFLELSDFLKSLNFESEAEINILEIGTAVGFTTFILQQYTNSQSPGKEGGVKRVKVDTIEHLEEHVNIAKENIEKWGGNIEKINFLAGEALDIFEKLHKNFYGIIFFDGYGIKLNFYEHFDNLLKVGGYLITANKHLKSTENGFFEKVNGATEKWQFITSFGDTIIYKKLS